MGITFEFILLGVIAISFFFIWQLYASMRKYKALSDGSHLERRFESLVENGLDCVIIISPEGKTTYVSRSVKNILGYTPSEVMDMDIRVMIHPDDIKGTESALLRTVENPGIPIPGYTSRIKHKDGSWRWIEPVITNLLDDPSINGIVDNFRDVTDRINAEEALIKANERFELATKGSKLGIWDRDMVNDILVWDEAMYKVFQVSKSNFNLNRDTWLSLVHEEDMPELQQQIDKLLNERIDLDWEFRIVSPAKSIHHIHSLAKVYCDKAEKPIRIIGTCLDITNYKEYEKILEQIIFDISHSIRRPVSSILGLSNLIEIENIDKNELQQLANYMKDAAQELDKITIALNEAYSKKKISINRLGVREN